MVFITSVLSRIPVIKFCKGGLGRLPTSPSSPTGAAPAAAGATAAQAAGAPMSTSAIPDIDLPARYKRQPISEEEIAYINGGGIV